MRYVWKSISVKGMKAMIRAQTRASRGRRSRVSWRVCVGEVRREWAVVRRSEAMFSS